MWVINQRKDDFAVSKLPCVKTDNSYNHRWKDGNHPLRQDPKFKLTSVPALVQWDANGAGARLDTDLETCKTAADVEAFVNKFLAS